MIKRIKQKNDNSFIPPPGYYLNILNGKDFSDTSGFDDISKKLDQDTLSPAAKKLYETQISERQHQLDLISDVEKSSKLPFRKPKEPVMAPVNKNMNDLAKAIEDFEKINV
jgi:hypothetical protein